MRRPWALSLERQDSLRPSNLARQPSGLRPGGLVRQPSNAGMFEGAMQSSATSLRHFVRQPSGLAQQSSPHPQIISGGNAPYAGVPHQSPNPQPASYPTAAARSPGRRLPQGRAQGAAARAAALTLRRARVAEPPSLCGLMINSRTGDHQGGSSRRTPPDSGGGVGASVAAAMAIVAGGTQLSMSSSEPGAAGASIGSGGVGASAAAAMAGGVGGGSADAGDDEPPKKKKRKRPSHDQRADIRRRLAREAEP